LEAEGLRLAPNPLELAKRLLYVPEAPSDSLPAGAGVLAWPQHVQKLQRLEWWRLAQVGHMWLQHATAAGAMRKGGRLHHECQQMLLWVPALHCPCAAGWAPEQ
jgi:hypothetical protein